MSRGSATMARTVLGLTNRCSMFNLRKNDVFAVGHNVVEEGFIWRDLRVFSTHLTRGLRRWGRNPDLTVALT